MVTAQKKSSNPATSAHNGSETINSLTPEN
jgi:hypothetical protein